MNIEILGSAIKKYPTPMYIFDVDEALENVKAFKKRFSPDIRLCFAMKANPFLTRQMASVVERVEVCSMGEFYICKKLQIQPEKILISGVLKEKEQLFEILNFYRGTCIYTVESWNQFQYFQTWCEENAEVISVYLRLTSRNQFGMERRMVEKIIAKRQQDPFLKIQGIHYFSGTQKKAKTMKKELAYLDAFFAELKEQYDFHVQTLEYGPGISVPYFKDQDIEPKEDLDMLEKALSEMKWKGTVVLELGRALAAPCGYYLTAIRDIKQNEKKNYCIVDGGIHQLHYDGQIRGMYCPKFQISPKQDDGIEENWTICGSLCTANDRLVQKVPVKNLKIGQVLIFEQVGAYAMTEGMALFLSHELPKVIFYNKKNGFQVVRQEVQTYHWNMEKETEDGNFDEYFDGNR